MIPFGYLTWPWKITMFKNGKPSISMGHLYHGKLLNYQKVSQKLGHKSSKLHLSETSHLSHPTSRFMGIQRTQKRGSPAKDSRYRFALINVGFTGWIPFKHG